MCRTSSNFHLESCDLEYCKRVASFGILTEKKIDADKITMINKIKSRLLNLEENGGYYYLESIIVLGEILNCNQSPISARKSSTK